VRVVVLGNNQTGSRGGSRRILLLLTLVSSRTRWHHLASELLLEGAPIVILHVFLSTELVDGLQGVSPADDASLVHQQGVEAVEVSRDSG